MTIPTVTEVRADLDALDEVRKLLFAVEQRYPIASSYRAQFFHLRAQAMALQDRLEAHYVRVDGKEGAL